MFIRMRIYESQQANHAAADDVFYRLVKPVHERHGARFLGRYRDREKRVVVMWAYTDEDSCQRIQAAVASDPETLASREARRADGLHACKHTEYRLESTEPKS